MAVVAAAAVVGPTVLAAPAMALDKPAVSMPDAAPQSEQQGTPTADVPDANAARQTAPAAQTPAPAPAVDAPHKTVASPRYRNNGPKVSMAGVPKGFTPGGDWTNLTVAVDNRGGLPVDEFVAAVGISAYDGTVKAEHIQAEVRQANGSWKPTSLRLDRGDTVYEVETGKRSVVPGQSYSVDVRIRFTVDTPAASIELYAGGEGRDESGQVVSPSTWFDSRVGEANPDEGGGEELPVFTGPKLGLTGLPQAGFKAGADWSEFSLHVDNSGRAAIDDYQLDLVLWVKNGAFKEGDINLEAYAPDAKGVWGWHPVLSDGSEEVWVHELASVDIEQNETFDLKLRLKFDAKTAPHDISLRTSGQNGWDDGSVHSEDVSHTSKVTGQVPDPDEDKPNPDTGTKPDGNGNGNQPKPDGGAKPVDNTNNNGSGHAGDQLAETGTDAATAWALGGAGIALSMGAALVAGTGRRRRTTA
ncbi:hypothetical protein ACIOD1_34345 [Streptomyces sp. NPDC088097]|uniref:hypothetical protein n=1 Tax=Streptomyces sp. NPDC088097 TaxID=3365823 RepID=UPI0037F75132